MGAGECELRLSLAEEESRYPGELPAEVWIGEATDLCQVHGPQIMRRADGSTSSASDRRVRVPGEARHQ